MSVNTVLLLKLPSPQFPLRKLPPARQARTARQAIGQLLKARSRVSYEGREPMVYARPQDPKAPYAVHQPDGLYYLHCRVVRATPGAAPAAAGAGAFWGRVLIGTFSLGEGRQLLLQHAGVLLSRRLEDNNPPRLPSAAAGPAAAATVATPPRPPLASSMASSSASGGEPVVPNCPRKWNVMPWKSPGRP